MLEATQTTSGEGVFERSRQWEGRVVNGIYALQQYIGGTDHSAVFLSETASANPQRVAIKLISADKANADVQLGRLQLSAKLSHPHLLQIFEAGRCQLDNDELLFVVMEFAEETLSQILPQRALSPAEVREMLKPTLDTLAYIHDNGLAHGHLRPTNILVAGEQLKLSSDGLAPAGAPASGPPSAYDPLEAQREGCTPAGDIWSLGITLAEALTQRLPTWADRLQGEPSLPEHLPEPFAEITRHCLVRDSRSRWKLSDIAARLQPPAPAMKKQPQTSPPQRIGKPQKPANNWLYAIPIAAMVGIILLLAGLYRRPSQRPEASANPASTTGTAPTSSNLPRAQVSKTPPGPFVTNQVLRQVVPAVPEKALRTITGRVIIRVRVKVDQNGDIAKAEMISAGPSRYFANLAMQAAQHWRFAPPQDASNVWMLQFVFEKTGVTAHPRRIA